MVPNKPRQATLHRSYQAPHSHQMTIHPCPLPLLWMRVRFLGESPVSKSSPNWSTDKHRDNTNEDTASKSLCS